METSMNPPLLTVFSIPKAFEGHFRVIQRNAIKSWVALGPTVEVILMGNEDGIAKVASEFRLRRIPMVETNRFGVPLISSIFEKAQQSATTANMLYANADIILTKDVLKLLGLLPPGDFLVSCRRWNVDINEEIDFESSVWEEHLRERLVSGADLDAPTAMDCFVFPRGMFKSIPPFSIGRAGWDNWMVYSARSRGIPVVDATGTITIVHQNHDYSHHPLGFEGTRTGPEAQENIALAGGRDFIFTLDNADWVLDSDGLRRPPLTTRTILRRLRAIPALHPRVAPLIKPLVYLGKTLVKKIVGADSKL